MKTKKSKPVKKVEKAEKPAVMIAVAHGASSPLPSLDIPVPDMTLKASDLLLKYEEEFKTNDFLGFEFEAISGFLPMEDILKFIKPEKVKEFKKGYKPKALTRENVIAEMRDYMDFAWDKAENHRGISAGRSVEKMQMWLWLLGDTEMLAFARKESNYSMYGCPILAAISKKYGFPVPTSDALEKMKRGEACGPACHGCH